MFRPAPHVLAGDTADVYFLRTRKVMEAEGLNPMATMEVFPHRDGLLCGVREVEALLRAPRRPELCSAAATLAKPGNE